MLEAALKNALERALGCKLAGAARNVSGGCIHAAMRVETDRGAVFVKHGPRSLAAQFEGECDGVTAINQAGAVRVPRVLACECEETHAFAVFEWLDLREPTATSDERLGTQLAALHATKNERFGWHRDNFIGATPQRNAWQQDWIEFWRTERLGFQLQLAQHNGAQRRLLDRGADLCERIGDFFVGYTPEPSLIHGDLWSGNRASDEHGQPVIFDPAVYCADREAELAMCHLFGGFSPRFFSAYEAAWSLAPGAATRRALYQLYHVLNHFNLFGRAYEARAEHLIEQLLAETRA